MILPCFNLILEPIDEKAKKLTPFRWASPEVGKRNKIGGLPTGIKENDYPICPCCGKKMTFYGQLDSINEKVVKLKPKCSKAYFNQGLIFEYKHDYKKAVYFDSKNQIYLRKLVDFKKYIRYLKSIGKIQPIRT